MSCKRAIYAVGYAVWVTFLMFAGPLFLYLLIIPMGYYGTAYMIGIAYGWTTNVFILTEGTLIIIWCLYRYLKKRKYYVWDTSQGNFIEMFESDYQTVRTVSPYLLVDPLRPLGNIMPLPQNPLLRNASAVSLDRYASKVSLDTSMTILIPAFLKNEAPIILKTLEHIGTINYPRKIHVILAFNGPEFPGKTDIIIRLQALKKRYEADYGKCLYLVEVERSRSKAENINMVCDMITEARRQQLRAYREERKIVVDQKIEEARSPMSQLDLSIFPVTEYIAIYDADHLMERNALIRAVYLMSKKKADVLQGRCVVYNNDSFLRKMLAVEFDIIYGLHHKGGELLRGMGFFGGSNGIWKTRALEAIKMDPTMLTEDIDSSMRAVQAGYKIIYSTDVISYELAPLNIWALCQQRCRWAQGWLQVTIKHTLPIIYSRHMGCWTKFHFVMLLCYRELIYYISGQTLVVFVAAILRRAYRRNDMLDLASYLSLCVLPMQLLIVYIYLRLDRGRIPPDDYRHTRLIYYILYIFFAPFYDYLKMAITVVAHTREIFMGEKTQWVITPRS